MWSVQQEAPKPMWSGTDQITWSNHVVGAENNTPFFSLKVFYCNSVILKCQVCGRKYIEKCNER